MCAVALGLACEVEDVELTEPVESPSVWHSREDCERLVAQRSVASTTPRVGTWNIRFFPDAGEEQPDEEDDATDIAWLACAIASLDTPLLLVQEFKRTERALTKQTQLIDRLNQLTGGNWQVELATCEPDEVQHPGFVFDANRVSASHFREIPSLNPDPVCSNEVSPGFAGYFSIAGGPDFHAVAVHMHTGEAPTSIDKRLYSITAMEQVVGEAYALVADADILFAGDFNTSGCEDCQPSLSSEGEIAGIAALVSGFSQPLSLLPASETCSREDGEDSHLMDHFAVAASMQEVPAGSVAHVSGICEALSCDRDKYLHIEARERLSDHCPVIIDLAATDDD